MATQSSSQFLSRTPSEPTSVKLTYVTDHEVKRLGRDGGEPQTVQTRPPSSVTFSIDTGAIAGVVRDKADIVVTNAPADAPGFARGYPGVLMSGVNRVAIERFTAFNPPPNVNPRNNVVEFLSSNTGATVWSVTVPTGYYLSSASLMTALVTALNSVTGSTGLTFSSSPIVASPDAYNLVVAGGFYMFVLTCVAITHGKYLWNLPDVQTLSSGKQVGPMTLLYTPYVDICSESIVQYARKKTSANFAKSPYNLVSRAFIFDSSDPVNNPKRAPLRFMETSSFDDANNFDWLTYDSSQDITVVDIQLRDCFGDLLYTPAPLLGQTNSSFNYILNFYYL